MRLLFDQNLSHRLISALEDLFPNSVHVRLLGLAEADDLAIWHHAIEHDLVIVTQDSDYFGMEQTSWHPPKDRLASMWQHLGGSNECQTPQGCGSNSGNGARFRHRSG